MTGTPLLRFGPPVLLLLALAAPVSAARALQQPYHLHIVLHVAEHRLLTPVFRDRVERELRDSLQEALGELGRVELSRTHPMLQRVLDRGLQHGLENWTTRGDVKTHFVLIDFNGSEYEIKARQHDGTTGLVNPCVRRDRTRDRDFVAKAAALLIAHDFGLLGTIVEPPGAQQMAKVELRGGGLASLAGWVRKGDVFALVPPGSGRAMSWALLQVEEPPGEEARDGLCTCRFFHRYKLTGSLAGARCIKLGTVRAPVRLRWMRQGTDGTLSPLNGEQSITVAVRQYGFSGEEKTLLSQTASEDGTIDTTRFGDDGVFKNVAFVTVTAGTIPEKDRPRVPIALVNDEPVIVPFAATAATDNLLALRILTWQRSVADSLLVQITIFQEIKALSDKPEQRSGVLARAEEGLKRSQTEYESLTSEKTALLEEAARSGKHLDVTREEKRLRDLKEGEKLLEDFVQKQRKIEAEENNPKTRALRARVEEGKLLEKDLEIDRALEVYKKVLDEGFNDPSLKKYYDELKNDWQPRNEDHRKARRFVYSDWPGYDTSRLKEKLPEARQAFIECKTAKDVYTIRKLFKGCEAHAIQLTKERADLHPELHAEDEKQAKVLDEVSKELIKLAEDIDGFLKARG
jgi:hypothetical protein